MSFFFGVSHTPWKTLPRQREVVTLDWSRVIRIVKWPLSATLMIITMIFLPALWGWQFHCTGTGNGGWSMANEGGVMPLSGYYTKKSVSYSIGDIVSFEYRSGATAQENGPSIKHIVSVNPDGSYTVAGLNEHCSVPPCNVPAADIRGKIIVRPVSIMPTAYWRWLSLNWTLNVDEISLRSERIFSLDTLVNVFSERGRWRNGLALDYHPLAIVEKDDLISIQDSGYVSLFRRDGEKVASLEGYLLQLHDNGATVVNDDGVWEISSQTTPQRIFGDPSYTAISRPNGKDFLSFEGDVRNSYRTGDQIMVNGQIREVLKIVFFIENSKPYTMLMVSNFEEQPAGITHVKLL